MALPKENAARATERVVFFLLVRVHRGIEPAVTRASKETSEAGPCAASVQGNASKRSIAGRSGQRGRADAKSEAKFPDLQYFVFKRSEKTKRERRSEASTVALPPNHLVILTTFLDK